jgi:hypothetical protein
MPGERVQKLPIEPVEPQVVDAEVPENLGDFIQASGIPTYRRIVSEDFDVPVRDPRRTPAFFRDEFRDGRRTRLSEHPERARDDLLEFGNVIEIELENVPESVAQWAGELGELGGGPDEGELRNVHFDARGPRSRSDHNVDLEVFHRAVENFFYLRLQAVDFVDKEDVVFFEARQER